MAVTPSPRCRPHWLIDDYYDADPSVPDKTYCKRGGFIDPVPFDPVKFGIPPNALQTTDSAQILALIAAKRVLDKVTGGRDDVDLDRTDIILGVASTTELVVQAGARLQGRCGVKAMLENGLSGRAEEISGDIAAHYPPWVESTFPGPARQRGRRTGRQPAQPRWLQLRDRRRVREFAGIVAVGAAPAVSARADTVITGGVDALNDVMCTCASPRPRPSPGRATSGRCRTALTEPSSVKAWAWSPSNASMTPNAATTSMPSSAASALLGWPRIQCVRPASEGQAKAVRAAYRNAGYEPTTIGLLEAHGTATKAGDAAEFAGLRSVFTDTDNRIAIGSVKSQIGHEGRRGLAGLIKAILALQHSPSGDPQGWSGPTPIWVLRRRRSISTAPPVRGCVPTPTPRRSSVSSFGFGGTNFHAMTLEQYGARTRRGGTLPTELVVLSGANEAGWGQGHRDHRTGRGGEPRAHRVRGRTGNSTHRRVRGRHWLPMTPRC